MNNDLKWRPLLGDDLFRKYSFLELYTFDGGGGFINRALLGSVDSAEIAELILRKKVLSDFGGLPCIDFLKFEKWRTIEKSCWINRCYFLPALAQHAWLTGDRMLATLVKQIMLHFMETCPPPEDILAHWKRVEHRMEYDYNRKTFEEYSEDETDVEYVWYDFQPASRIVNFLHSLYFIKDLADFQPGEYQRIVEGIWLHGRVIYKQECSKTPKRGNHQSLRQVALLHAAELEIDADEAAKWREYAFERGQWHIVIDFFQNGTLAENAPSYHAFETWHGRDILLMARRRNCKVTGECLQRMELAAKVLEAYRRPDGKTLTINDAYPLAPDGLLASMGIDISSPPRHTLLDQGGLAVFRGAKFYAAMDVSNFTGKFSHYHAGKNAFILYYDGEAFIDDPGCCNYDDSRFRSCKQGEAHSSLLVDGFSDARSFSVYGFDCYPELDLDSWKGDIFSATETSSVPAWNGVSFKRTMECGDAGIVLNDNVTCDAEHAYTLLFTLAPGIKVKIVNASQLLLEGAKNTVKFEVFSKDACCSLLPATSYQSDPSRESMQLRISFAPAKTLSSRISFSAI